MDRPKSTPKDFFLWAGAMVALYASVFSLINLLFDYINYAYPDPLQYFPANPYQGGVSYEMASLIVLFPIFLVLSWAIGRDIARDATRKDIWVRRWALTLTLFLAGATVAIDLITLLMYFFNGELGTRFLLKVLVAFLIAGAGFLHFWTEMRGYWERFPSRKRSIAIASCVLVACTVVAGFLVIGTPMQARLYAFDDEKVGDLMTIQSQIVSYWQHKQVIPAKLSDLNDPLGGFTVPVDPQSGASFDYTVVTSKSFRLCATFNAETRPYSTNRYSAPVPAGAAPNAENDSWYHSAGRSCFTRIIDPSRYPPLKT